MELGMLAGRMTSKKVIVKCPKEYARAAHVEYVCGRFGFTLVRDASTMFAAVGAALHESVPRERTRAVGSGVPHGVSVVREPVAGMRGYEVAMLSGGDKVERPDGRVVYVYATSESEERGYGPVVSMVFPWFEGTRYHVMESMAAEVLVRGADGEEEWVGARVVCGLTGGGVVTMRLKNGMRLAGVWTSLVDRI